MKMLDFDLRLFMNIQQAVDLTRNSISENRITDDLRPLPGTSYPLGTVLQYVAQDSQAWIDFRTVQPSPLGAAQLKLAGVICEDFIPLTGVTGVLNTTLNKWGGFDGSGSPAAAASGARGTQKVAATIYGYHPLVLIDNSNAGAVNLTDGVPLGSSQNSAGYAQGVTSPTGNAQLGWAALPAAGVGSSLTKGAITQASQTVTIASPATNDIYFVTVQVSEIQTAPGTAQTRTIVIGPLTATQAGSATLAANQAVALLNADPVFLRYYIATNSAGVITVTALANALYARYFPAAWINPGTNLNLTPFLVSLSGSAGNGLTISSGTTSGSGTATAGAGSLAAGAGFKGYAPAFIAAQL